MDKNEFLICIDSDGCAIDSMNHKHLNFFGPALISTWKLQNCADEVQQKWNQVNLFSKTRGINRFLGLKITLESLKEGGISLTDLKPLQEWTSVASVLSNNTLEEYIVQHSHGDNDLTVLHKALEWSFAVNDKIKNDKTASPPFLEVEATLKEIAKIADVAIVSSANKSAVKEEWAAAGFEPYVKELCTQEEGSKSFCIKKLIENNGYEKNKALMVGDALGDLAAAQENDICFYPIIAGDEATSWKNLRTEVLNAFINGAYKNEIHQSVLDKFYKILK